jgi:mRNA-degrading endonuclease RelE of RelBE toxin-antitoxin system
VSYKLFIAEPAELQLRECLSTLSPKVKTQVEQALQRFGNHPPKPRPLVEVAPGRLRYDFVIRDGSDVHCFVVAYSYVQGEDAILITGFGHLLEQEDLRQNKAE